VVIGSYRIISALFGLAMRRLGQRHPVGDFWVIFTIYVKPPIVAVFIMRPIRNGKISVCIN
jgi:hypothetical protein